MFSWELSGPGGQKGNVSTVNRRPLRMGIGEPKTTEFTASASSAYQKSGRVSKIYFKRNVDSQEVTKNIPKRSIELFAQLPQTT